MCTENIVQGKLKELYHRAAVQSSQYLHLVDLSEFSFFHFENIVT